MERLCFWVNLLAGLLLSGFCVRSSLAFPHDTQVAQQHSEEQKAPAEEQEQVNTVSVACHPDSLEIIIRADLFEIGAPVRGEELRLGVAHDDYCRATASSADEYRINVGLVDCGTKHWMTEDSLVYTNLLIYSPVASPDGLVRMDEAVIPVECHYERKYSLSSSSLTPTWIPFMSTQAAVETLQFDLRIMTGDWLYERSSNVFYLGDPIAIEASVRVGHHMGLRVFLSSCVATLDPDIYSVPRYVFIENGCLVDSQLPGSKSHYVTRMRDDKLHLVIDAFRFHNEDRGQLFITCHLNAVPVNDAQAPNKACTSVSGRWRSADGNDYLCGQCQSQNEVSQTQSSPGKFGPRGFEEPAEPEPFWRSGLKANTVWEQEARVGPLLVLPSMQKSGPLPVEALPPVLNKISRPALYGSQWRGGINNRRVDLDKGLLPDQVEVQTADLDKDVTSGKDDGESEVAGTLVDAVPVVPVLESNGTAALGDVRPSGLSVVEVTAMMNATESGLSDTTNPKRK